MALMPVAPRAQRGAAGVFDVRDVRRHLRPDGFLRGTHHPAADFLEDVRVFAHRRAHLAFRQTVRAGEIQFKPVHAARLAALDDFNPRVLAIFLHDGGDEHAVGEHVLALLEFVLPNLERPVADQFDVLPADDFLAVAGQELRVTRRDVDDLRGVEADGLGDDRAPAFVERLADDVEIRARRPGADDERIRQFKPIYACGQCWHNLSSGYRISFLLLRRIPQYFHNGKNTNERSIESSVFIKLGFNQVIAAHDGIEPFQRLRAIMETAETVLQSPVPAPTIVQCLESS